MRQYERDGYFIRESIFDINEINELRAAAESAAQKALSASAAGRAYLLDGNRFVDVGYLTVQFEHLPGSRTIRVIEPVHELDHRFEALIDDIRIVNPMRDIIGVDAIALWTAKLNLKRAREGSGFGWHQDSPYWIHDCQHVDQLPNIMVTFDDADKRNGCLRFIRGSHKNGCLPGSSDGRQMGGFFTDPACFDESDQVEVEVSAGSQIFFSPHIIHGSGPNHSGDMRRAIIITYQPGGWPQLKSGVIRNIAQTQE